MVHWVPYAFVRIAICFCAGIILGIYFPDIMSVPYAIGILACLVFGYFTVVTLKLISQRKWIDPGFLGLAALFFIGYLNVLFNTDARNENHLTAISTPVEYYRGVVTDYPQEKENSWKQTIKVSFVKTNGKWQHYTGKVLLYFSKKTFDVPYTYGDELIIKGRFQNVQAPSNPGEFDYQKFLSFRNIGHQHYLNKDGVLYIAHSPPSRIISAAIKVREWSENKLKAVVKGEREQALACALVLGIVDGLDNEMLDAYAATGTMHVLAVSGLHVGILYWILLLVLRPLKKYKWGKWIITILSLFVLWGYACVTGLSPSVLRAVVMFSFMAVAYPLNFRTNIYNTLAASAVCILLINPYLLMSVGFQLSYLAVLGIVYFYPFLYGLIEPANKFWDEIWKISCVSIAAQLATLALGLFYFHQFPNYFLLSNLVVVPLSFVILVSGLTILAFSFIHPLIYFLGYLLTYMIKLLNYMIFAVEAFPFSLIEGIYITATQCWMVIIFIVSVSLFFKLRKVYYLYLCMACVTVFSFISWNHFLNEISQPRIVIYKVSGYSAFDLMDRGSAYFFADSILQTDKRKLSFHIHPNRLQCGINQLHALNEQAFIKPFQGGQLVLWKGKVIMRLNQSDFRLPESIHVDYLIVSENAVENLDMVFQQINPLHTIIDTSNSLYSANRLVNTKTDYTGKIHSVWHHGAFEARI